MHPCLSIAEIVRHIASYRDGKTHATQLNFGLTCHAFYEPAMDALWETLKNDIEPLLRLLPERVLARHAHHGLMIAQAPQGDDWARFEHHAKRVAHIRIERLSHKVYHTQVLRKLCEAYPGPHPLPGLIGFQCGDHLDLGAQWGKLLPPTIRDVFIASYSTMNPVAFFSVVLERPALRRLGFSEHPDFYEDDLSGQDDGEGDHVVLGNFVDGDDDDDEDDDSDEYGGEDYNQEDFDQDGSAGGHEDDDEEDGQEAGGGGHDHGGEDDGANPEGAEPLDLSVIESSLNAVLLRHDQLTALDMDVLLPTSIQLLAALPALEVLSFTLDSNFHYGPFVRNHEGHILFPALKSLNVRAPRESPDALVGFLEALRQSPVEVIFIIFGLGEWSFGDDDDDAPNAEAGDADDAQPRYLTQVTAALAQIASLRKLILDTDEKCARLREFRLDGASLAPLLALRGLQHLLLSTYPVSLAADALGRIPAAWPDLATLELGQHYGYDYTPSGAAGLLPFAACRRLETFALNLDPEVGAELLKRRPSSTLSVCPLKTLSIGEEDIVNPRHLAALLSGVFPHVQLAGYGKSPERDEVNRLIPLFVEADKAAAAGSSGHNSAAYTIEDLLSGRSKV